MWHIVLVQNHIFILKETFSLSVSFFRVKLFLHVLLEVTMLLDKLVSFATIGLDLEFNLWSEVRFAQVLLTSWNWVQAFVPVTHVLLLGATPSQMVSLNLVRLVFDLADLTVATLDNEESLGNLASIQYLLAKLVRFADQLVNDRQLRRE